MPSKAVSAGKTGRMPTLFIFIRPLTRYNACTFFNFFTKCYAVYEKNITFAPNWFQEPFFAFRIKRESGENPGQSRCCDAPLAS